MVTNMVFCFAYNDLQKHILSDKTLSKKDKKFLLGYFRGLKSHKLVFTVGGIDNVKKNT